ncbi:MAG: protein translocase subunit SecF [Dokdonella sp.]|uniref:protein translocase subunit SecF n=1 Tax=Dokdonella sp. TaxID=2291710 RepID=UPI002CC4AE72|nr:protein translocase subunit SecF [Dokdonella sp.]HOX72107.1 protein translocase subunit SecF [Dokdonella sp.]HPG94901.1 protein translocase subunit SecF [Dokdonella sp.]HPN78781.1 protein translocase subunit SecF [Dokdonella sp.]
MELFNPNSNIDFMRWRKVSLGVSALLMIVSVAIIFVRGLDYGLDFTGGANVEVTYENAIDVADVRAALTEGGFDKAVVQTYGGTNDFAIRIVADEQATSTTEEASVVANDKIAVKVLEALHAKRPDAKVVNSEFVGAQVGDELRSDGLVAVIFVIAGISIYLWIRFEWRFAVSAVASEIHDTLITVAAFALTGREFDLPALAAVLSVVGYSINDKIVVFDRVREIFRSSRKGDSADILNRSVNSTLSRTIMTGVTTALAVGTLYFLGGPALENFGLIMLIGIFIGIASSIFFANPVLLLLGVSKQDLMPVTRNDPELERRP